MSVFNVLPSGVNTFFPTFWKHPDALLKKGLWLAAYPLPNSLDDGVVVRRWCGSFCTRSLPSLKHLHHSNTWFCERHSSPYCCWSLVNFSGQRCRHPECSGVDTPPTTSLFWKEHQDASRTLAKMCWLRRGYVEDWHVQVSVWQLWFKKKKNQSRSYLNPPCICVIYTWLVSVAYRGGRVWGFKPPAPKFRRPSKIMPNNPIVKTVKNCWI